MVPEQYPNLRANQGFRDLSAQLEGTENRITVARNRYILTVQSCNVAVRSFPSNLTAMVFGYKVMAGTGFSKTFQVGRSLLSASLQVILLAAALGWPALSAGGRAATDGACDRPDRHADRGAQGHAGTNAHRL